MKYGIAIVGAGLIGNKRAATLKKFKNCQLVVTADVRLELAQNLAKEYGGEAMSDWRQAVKRSDVDIVIVSTSNQSLAEVSIAALKNKKHILCEKPFGRNVKESKQILAAAKRSGWLVKVGFDHRFYPHVQRAKEELDKGTIGRLLVIRGRYGHGGRVGMEKEWRAQKNIAGGGELLDQGTHLIDLCCWFGGEPTEVMGMVATKFWPIEVEDNAFVILENKNVISQFHVSTTNWGNIFSLELFGDKGAMFIDGKGGRYGEPTLKIGIKQLPYGNLEIKTFHYSDTDNSWSDEWKNFLKAIEGKEKISGDGNDGLRTNKIVEEIYNFSKSHSF